MTEQFSHKPANHRQPKARRFYIVGPRLAGEKRPNFEVMNLDVLRAGALALYPPEGRRGFPDYRERPRIAIGSRRNAHPPRDIELFHSYWLISDHLMHLRSRSKRAMWCFATAPRGHATGCATWLEF
jgi:Protein of unknown function (DUF1629)